MRLIDQMEPSWPAEEVIPVGPFRLRRTKGAGSRVSCATCDESSPEIKDLEEAAQSLGQEPLVMIRSGEAALDAHLAALGWQVAHPVSVMSAPVARLTAALPPITAFAHWPPLAIQRALWSEGNIGPARRAVMARATGPKAALLGRISDRAAGTAFVACAGDTAFLHALHVAPEFRRAGMGRQLVQAAANWAEAQGAARLALSVETANTAACGLYAALGMAEAEAYHFRRKP